MVPNITSVAGDAVSCRNISVTESAREDACLSVVGAWVDVYVSSYQKGKKKERADLVFSVEGE